MPSTTPRQTTAQGSASFACMARVYRGDIAAAGLFAWTVASRPAVRGVERLNQVGRLGPADLADDDVIGPVPQRVPHQVQDCHGGTGEPARLVARGVGAAEPHGPACFYGDDAVRPRQQRDEDAQERRPAGAGSGFGREAPGGPIGWLERAKTTAPATPGRS